MLIEVRTAVLCQVADNGDMAIDDLIRRINVPANDVRDEIEVLIDEGKRKKTRMGRYVEMTIAGRQAAHDAGATIPSPLDDSECLLAYLAQLGDGDDRGRIAIGGVRLEGELGWSRRQASDAAELLDANGLGVMRKFVGGFDITLTARGRRAA